MKNLATLALAVAGLALVTGCSGPGAQAEPSAPPLPTSQYSGSGSTEGPKPNKTMWDYQAPAMKEKVFYTEARKGTTTLKAFANDQLTTMSQITCASLGNGETSKDVLLKKAMTSATGSEEGLTAAVTRDLTSALNVGTQNYCPDLNPAFAKAP